MLNKEDFLKINLHMRGQHFSNNVIYDWYLELAFAGASQNLLQFPFDPACLENQMKQKYCRCCCCPANLFLWNCHSKLKPRQFSLPEISLKNCISDNFCTNLYLSRHQKNPLSLNPRSNKKKIALKRFESKNINVSKLFSTQRPNILSIYIDGKCI